MPRALACLGPWTWTSWPSQTMVPPSKGWMPAIDLISVLLPAPLSPTSAVTCPRWASKSTPRSTCTAPKLLSTWRRDSNGCPCAVALGATAMGPGYDADTPYFEQAFFSAEVLQTSDPLA